MRVSEMNWLQVEEYLQRDDRAVLPLGSTEQHAYLSLSTDTILAERVAAEAAHPLGIPVFPVLAYGITPYFRAYPGSPSLRVATYISVVLDLLDSLAYSGFRRILVVNGHGGNQPAQNAPQVWSRVQEIDPEAAHASWMENYPWTRLSGVEMPAAQKSAVDLASARTSGPVELRARLGDGNYGGYYQRSDVEMLSIWQVAVAETRELLAEGW